MGSIFFLLQEKEHSFESVQLKSSRTQHIWSPDVAFQTVKKNNFFCRKKHIIRRNHYTVPMKMNEALKYDYILKILAALLPDRVFCQKWNMWKFRIQVQLRMSKVMLKILRVLCVACACCVICLTSHLLTLVGTITFKPNCFVFYPSLSKSKQ